MFILLNWENFLSSDGCQRLNGCLDYGVLSDSWNMTYCMHKTQTVKHKI